MGILDLFLQSSSSISLLGALLVLLLVYLVSSSSFSSQKEGKEPPGPRPLPVLGNLLQLDLKRPYHTLLKLSKKYGSVFTVYLGPKKVVVLTGYKTVKEALVNHAEEFGERDPLPIMHEYEKGHGILWSNGDSWKEMRRFALTNLRDFGMGRKASEDKIIEECNNLIGVLKKFKGEAFDTTLPIKYAVCNNICSIVYGSRFEYDDPEFTSLVDSISARLQLLGSPSIQVYNMFPRFCKWIANRRSFLRWGAASIKQNLQLFSRLKETLNPQMCRGFVDAFLVRKQKLEKSGITNSHFHDENLMITVQNLFSAGTETSATTLRWGLLLMAKYANIQDQVQEEVSREIGSRQVQVEDRKNLHFTNAVIHDTQRLANIAPMSLPHRTTQDVTFQGYVIKKGTAVAPLLISVLYDESEWERPHSFYPAHFLDKDGKFVKREAFMPFSAGHRACPGESLARMELFIFFTTLLQHFRFTPPPGVSEDELDLTPHLRLTLDPLPHKLCAAPVHEEEEGLRI
ncbi:cytochrome P450 2K1-like [Sander lucioperca]|uniref:cytochrome P450 2K1-like n=1 Tax=Sander lucioperca TaxID=283035 RepID=UPI001653478D|nr:cytochrome P450 2K1-like [Sander lucioperca]